MSVIDDYRNGRSASIPTTWNGQQYRSRFEAEVAQFLDFHFVRGRKSVSRIEKGKALIEYEPISFRLDNGMNFCPDFRITTEGGTHALYVEARGYDDPQSRLQLDQFGLQEMRTFGRPENWNLFLVISSTGVFLYRHQGEFRSFEPQSPSDVYFIICHECGTPTVVSLDWADAKSCGDHLACRTAVPTLKFVRKPTGFTIPQDGLNLSHPCHHCGLVCCSRIFTGDHCFSIHIEDFKIHLQTYGAQLIPLNMKESESGRLWLETHQEAIKRDHLNR